MENKDFLKYEHLVEKMVKPKRFTLSKELCDDLYQHLSIALWKAFEKYDETKGEFKNYALFSLKRERMNFLRQNVTNGFCGVKDIVADTAQHFAKQKDFANKTNNEQRILILDKLNTLKKFKSLKKDSTKLNYINEIMDLIKNPLKIQSETDLNGKIIDIFDIIDVKGELKL